MDEITYVSIPRTSQHEDDFVIIQVYMKHITTMTCSHSLTHSHVHYNATPQPSTQAWAQAGPRPQTSS